MVSLGQWGEREEMEGVLLTGCAEKRMRGWRKTEAHTVAVSWWGG